MLRVMGGSGAAGFRSRLVTGFWRCGDFAGTVLRVFSMARCCV